MNRTRNPMDIAPIVLPDSPRNGERTAQSGSMPPIEFSNSADVRNCLIESTRFRSGAGIAHPGSRAPQPARTGLTHARSMDRTKRTRDPRIVFEESRCTSGPTLCSY